MMALEQFAEAVAVVAGHTCHSIDVSYGYDPRSGIRRLTFSAYIADLGATGPKSTPEDAIAMLLMMASKADTTTRADLAPVGGVAKLMRGAA